MRRSRHTRGYRRDLPPVPNRVPERVPDPELPSVWEAIDLWSDGDITYEEMLVIFYAHEPDPMVKLGYHINRVVQAIKRFFRGL
jgi:hypothetical protein